MAEAPKPILVHCKSSADRAGSASALYVAAIANQGEAVAESQISISHGRVLLPIISPAYAMDRTFEKLVPWRGLGKPHVETAQ